MMYLLIAGATALLTVLITTDSYQLLLLPFLSLAQLDWGTVPSLIQCARGTGRLLTGKKESELPSCYPDFAANLQVLGLFNAHVECQNRVAVELAKRAYAGDNRAAVTPPAKPETAAPAEERPSIAAHPDADDAADSATSGRCSPTVMNQRVNRSQPETRRLRKATSLAEALKSARAKMASTADIRPPQWSCSGLRHAIGSPASMERPASEYRFAKAERAAPRWRMPSKRQPFRGGASAA